MLNYCRLNGFEKGVDLCLDIRPVTVLPSAETSCLTALNNVSTPGEIIQTVVSQKSEISAEHVKRTPTPQIQLCMWCERECYHPTGAGTPAMVVNAIVVGRDGGGNGGWWSHLSLCTIHIPHPVIGAHLSSQTSYC